MNKRFYLVIPLGLTLGATALALFAQPAAVQEVGGVSAEAGDAASADLYLPERQPMMQQEPPSVTGDSPGALLDEQLAASVPISPPVASLISVGTADLDGIAVVSGTAGAVPPSSAVYVASLDTASVTSTLALSDGSFQTSLFAPAGAWVQVKYGSDYYDNPVVGGEQDVSWLNALPGTIVRAPVPDDSPSGAFPFAIAGVVNKSPGAGNWMFQGHVITQTNDPGVEVIISGTLRVATSAITPGTTISDDQVIGDIQLRRFFDQSGQRVPDSGVFASTFQTPTGLPISRSPMHPSPISQEIAVTGWSYVGAHAMQATVSSTLNITYGIPSGYFRPHIHFRFTGVPPGPPESFTRWGINYGTYLPMLRFGNPAPPHLIWTLLTNTLSNATRGAVARQDRERFGLIPHIITQADTFFVPRTDPRTGQPIAYRLEPFLPLVSMGDRSVPGQPLIPFQFPSGYLTVSVRRPDGTIDTFEPAPFVQSMNTSPTNRDGKVLDMEGGRIDEAYQLTTLEDRFVYTFQQYGHHVITLTGTISDTWGNTYLGEGTYDVHVARALRLDPGQLPTTPYEVGDAFSPNLQVYPPVPADVEIRLVHLPNSDPASPIERMASGQANRFGYFQPPSGTVITMTTPGEFRVDITASYVDPDGTLWMGSATWGNVVEDTAASNIVAHGRRGRDLAGPYDQVWFYHRDLLAGAALHSMYPYWTGDILWGIQTDTQYGGDAIIPAVSIQDSGGGIIENIIVQRWNNKAHSNLYEGPDFSVRQANAELPLFSTTSDGMDLFWSPNLIDQYGYAYRSSERPGVRVHETISEDALGISYWRFDAEFGLQAGFAGDLPNDLKWEFGGAVFRVISETNPINEYSIYGSLWVLLPDNDPDGARVTQPFQGAAGGMSGGPIMVLKGQPIDLFLLPRGVQPGDVLELGDTFSFAGHVGPPLNSWVTATVTTPAGVTSRVIAGRANKVGWFYNPAEDFPVLEPGVWTVHVEVLHDVGLPSGGTPIGFNTGGVLGSADGRYHFYVVEPASQRLPVLSPQPGYLTWPTDPLSHEPITVTAVPIEGMVPAGLSGAVISYTIRMPGFILDQGTIAPSGSRFTITYDPLALNQDFPNLDLTARDANLPGLTDPVLVTFLLTGYEGPQRVHRAGTVFFDGEEVHTLALTLDHSVYLPLVLRGG